MLKVGKNKHLLSSPAKILVLGLDVATKPCRGRGKSPGRSRGTCAGGKPPAAWVFCFGFPKSFGGSPSKNHSGSNTKLWSSMSWEDHSIFGTHCPYLEELVCLRVSVFNFWTGIPCLFWRGKVRSSDFSSTLTKASTASLLKWWRSNHLIDGWFMADRHGGFPMAFRWRCRGFGPRTRDHGTSRGLLGQLGMPRYSVHPCWLRYY